MKNERHLSAMRQKIINVLNNNFITGQIEVNSKIALFLCEIEPIPIINTSNRKFIRDKEQNFNFQSDIKKLRKI